MEWNGMLRYDMSTTVSESCDKGGIRCQTDAGTATTPVTVVNGVKT
jgi:hypothetical protein